MQVQEQERIEEVQGTTFEKVARDWNWAPRIGPQHTRFVSIWKGPYQREIGHPSVQLDIVPNRGHSIEGRGRAIDDFEPCQILAEAALRFPRCAASPRSPSSMNNDQLMLRTRILTH